MPDTIIDYLENEQRSFSELPFNPVDSLVLSSLCYCNFEAGPLGSAAPKDRLEIQDAIAGVGFDALFASSWMSDRGEALPRSFIANLILSPRFKGMTAGFFARETAETIEKQFSATTFFLPDGSAYIAYRGTDGTLAGWKEDFNLCFMDVVPSQRSALNYLSGIASSCDCPLIVGGHSKGGNLAEYAALTVSEDVYKRITAVYDHDGPSFAVEPSPRIDEDAYRIIQHKTVPESSVFGMILEQRSDYRILESTAFAIMQHNPFSWVVDGDDFSYRTDRTPGATYFDASLNQWCLQFTPEERGRFIDTMYDLIKQTDIETASDFSDKMVFNIASVIQNAAKLDEDTRNFLIKVMAAAANTLKSEALRQIKESSPMQIPQANTLSVPESIAARLKSMNPFGKAEEA